MDASERLSWVAFSQVLQVAFVQEHPAKACLAVVGMESKVSRQASYQVLGHGAEADLASAAHHSSSEAGRLPLNQGKVGCREDSGTEGSHRPGRVGPEIAPRGTRTG